MAVDNLKNIDGTWYVRVAIPRDVRSEFGNRTEFFEELEKLDEKVRPWSFARRICMSSRVSTAKSSERRQRLS